MKRKGGGTKNSCESEPFHDRNLAYFRKGRRNNWSFRVDYCHVDPLGMLVGCETTSGCLHANMWHSHDLVYQGSLSGQATEPNFTHFLYNSLFPNPGPPQKKGAWEQGSHVDTTQTETKQKLKKVLGPADFVRQGLPCTLQQTVVLSPPKRLKSRRKAFITKSGFSHFGSTHTSQYSVAAFLIFQAV